MRNRKIRTAALIWGGKNALCERARTGHQRGKCLLWGLVVDDGAFLEVEGFMVLIDDALSPVAVIVK